MTYGNDDKESGVEAAQWETVEMNEFGFSATDEALGYLREIASSMVDLFGVSSAEAVGRMRQFWPGQAFRTDYALMALFHRSPEGWAKTIYYGGKPWWLEGQELTPAPYRPEP